MCDVQLATYITVTERGGDHIEFVLCVSGLSSKDYLLYKRFSEFEELVSVLSLSAGVFLTPLPFCVAASRPALRPGRMGAADAAPEAVLRQHGPPLCRVQEGRPAAVHG